MKHTQLKRTNARCGLRRRLRDTRGQALVGEQGYRQGLVVRVPELTRFVESETLAKVEEASNLRRTSVMSWR